MMKHVLPIAALAAVTWSEPAGAVVFDAMESSRTFTIDRKFSAASLQLFRSDGAPANRDILGGLGGFITLGKRTVPVDPRRPEGNVPRDGMATITFEDILDLALTITIPLDTDGLTTTVPVTPLLGGLDFLGGTFTTDGTNLFVDASGLSTGNPFLQVTRDRFPDVLGFPNGQRYGDDATDQLLLQLVKGSVNVLTASLPDGVASPPGVIGFGEVSGDDTVILATVTPDAPVSAVPLPASLLFGLSALAGLAAFRRRR